MISQVFIKCNATSHLTAVTTNTHPRTVFSLCLTWVYVDVCSHGFSCSLTEDFSSLNEERRLTRMGWNEGGIFDCFIRWGITLRSLQAKWNIQNILYSLRKVFRLFIYLIVWKHGSSGRITKKYKFKEMKNITPKMEKVSS